MPELPRKDTKKRFKKLLTASGKSGTISTHGASDISKIKISTYDPGNEKLITKFKNFMNEKISKKKSIKDYFEEIMDIFKTYKGLTDYEANDVIQQHIDELTKEFEKGTPICKLDIFHTYVV